MNATQKQALVDASDTFIKDATPEMVDINTKAHGYTVFSAGSSSLVAETRTIDTTEVSNNLYSLSPSQLDKKFNRKSFSLAKDTTSGLLHSVPAPQFNGGTVATSTQFTPLSYQIIASNTPTAYAASGLPSGLSLNSSTGLISGTVTAAGTYTVTLTATNATGAASKTLVVSVNEPVVRVGEAVSLNLGNLRSGTNQLALKSGTLLPSGLQFNATTGVLSGKVAAAAGTYSFDVLEKSGSTTVRTVSVRVSVEALPEALSGSFESVLETGKLLTPSGVLRVSLTRLGRWTASLDFAGAFQRSAAGSFSAVPGTTTASVNINFPAQGNCAAVSTTLNLGGALPLISGTYTAGTETGVIRGVRLANASELPAEECKLTGLFDSGDQDGVTYPAGFGWVKGFATRQGSVILTGMLGDSKPVAASLHASASGQAVVWQQPYRSRASYVGGVIDVKNITQTLSSTARLAPGLTWHRQADSADVYASSSFAAPLQISAWVSRFVPRAVYSDLATALGLTNRLFTLETDGAGLSNATPNLKGLPTQFRLDSGFRLTPLNNATNVQWSGLLNSLDGTFSGSLLFPSAARSSVVLRASAYGVLLQDDQAQLDGLVGGGIIRTPIESRAGLFGSAMLQLSK
jgi:PKD repeat protein